MRPVAHVPRGQQLAQVAPVPAEPGQDHEGAQPDPELLRQVNVLAAQNMVAINAYSQSQQELHMERLKSTFIEEQATGVIAELRQQM